MKIKEFISEFYWIAAIPIIIWALISTNKEKKDIMRNKTKTYGMVYGSTPIHKKYSKSNYNYEFYYNGKKYTGSSTGYLSENIKYGNFYKVEFSFKNPEHSQMIFDTAFVQKIETNINGKIDTFYIPFKQKVKNDIKKLIEKYQLHNDRIKKSKPHLLLDTLVFDKRMNQELLAEKYTEGLKELNFYKKFISQDKINSKQILKEKDSKSEITYLGKIKDLENQKSYHIIKNFKIIGIGIMDSPRGISKLIFLDIQSKKLITYNMGLPDSLPEKIEENILYFNLQSQEVGISISGGLPPMLCLPVIGCN